MMRMLAILALALSLGGCAAVEAGDDRPGYLLGVMRTKPVEKVGDIRAVDRRVLGLGWGAGGFVGWRRSEEVSADPAQCQLIVIIRSTVEAAQATRILAELGERPACIANFSGASPPLPSQPPP